MSATSVLGWAALSRSALNRAEAELVVNAEGMRDEVGVLALHAGYANRFFPGTSVQQTRLRYALFVPWQINALLAQMPNARDPRKALRESELALAKRLPDEEGEGTIGRIRARQGKHVSIPPSESYWVGLTQWGILEQSPPIRPAATRSELFDRWQHWPLPSSKDTHQSDDEKRPLTTKIGLFHAALPSAPEEFLKGANLDFKLLPKERDFLRKRLMETVRPSDNKPSYLSCLVRAKARVGKDEAAWSEKLRSHADQFDQAALLRARDSAALSVIARAIYYAAVEAICEKYDGRTPGDKHRKHLPKVLKDYGSQAVRLDLSAVEADGIALGGLQPVLSVLQRWIQDEKGNPIESEVLKTLAEWEFARKDKRARLPLTGHGRDARAEWNASKTDLAVPITYRWSLIARYLEDIAEQ